MIRADRSPVTQEERERLILDNLPIVRRIALRMRKRLPKFIRLDDLLSAGAVGLIEAVDSFDPQKGAKLETFAGFRILGAMLDNRRQSDWASRRMRRWLLEIEAAADRAEQRVGGRPEEADLAREMNVSVERYRNIVARFPYTGGLTLEDAGRALRALKEELASRDESPEDEARRKEVSRALASAVAELAPPEEMVVLGYFVGERSLREIAGLMGVSVSHVCKIKSRALARLRGLLSDRLGSSGVI